MRQAIRVLTTLVLVAAAIYAGFWIWNYYLFTPWTREGRIRAEVITIAPDVSGWVTELNVSDNQPVQQGDVLFSIDDRRYRAAIAQAEAHVEHQRYAWELGKHQYERRKQLNGAQTISPEDLEAVRINAELTKANYRLAQTKLESVEIDLQRTVVKAPVDGAIVNLSLRRGNYVAQGKPVLSLIQKDTFYATGYFEETKIPLIRVGQRARVRLVSGGRELQGRVVSIARGIADASATSNDQLLPQVQPTFNWVRLAQRIPVNFALDAHPEDVVLSTGMTATITILDDDAPIDSKPDKNRADNKPATQTDDATK